MIPLRPESPGAEDAADERAAAFAEAHREEREWLRRRWCAAVAEFAEPTR